MSVVFGNAEVTFIMVLQFIGDAGLSRLWPPLQSDLPEPKVVFPTIQSTNYFEDHHVRMNRFEVE